MFYITIVLFTYFPLNLNVAIIAFLKSLSNNSVMFITSVLLLVKNSYLGYGSYVPASSCV